MKWSETQKLFVVVAFVVLCTAGCSLFTVHAGGPSPAAMSVTPAPAPMPQPTAAHVEARAQAAQFSADTLARVQTDGAKPAAPLVKQAATAAAMVSKDVGQPAEPVALPAAPSTDAAPQADVMLSHYGKVVGDVVTPASQAPPPKSGRAVVTDVLYGLGGFGIVLALGLIVGLKQVVSGLKVGALAIGCMGVAYVLDQWLWVIAVLVCVGIVFGVLEIVAAIRGQTLLQMLGSVSTTLGVVVSAVEGLPADVKKVVTGAVGAKAAATNTTDTVEATVKAAKAYSPAARTPAGPSTAAPPPGPAAAPGAASA